MLFLSKKSSVYRSIDKKKKKRLCRQWRHVHCSRKYLTPATLTDFSLTPYAFRLFSFVDELHAFPGDEGLETDFFKFDGFF